MAQRSQLGKPWRLLIPGSLYAQLQDHLFPGDGDEHGAVLLAGVAETDREVRLLARELHLARDGSDYVPGKRGYRMMRAEFIQRQVLKARDEKLVYLAIHNHPCIDRVSFSEDDLRSHERGYPALIDITGGSPVGALVFAEQAIAGDIWLSAQDRVSLDSATVVGRRRLQLTAAPSGHGSQVDSRFDRQVRLFGDRGQHILGQAKVAVIGLGGMGSLIAEILGRLGVGHFVLVDPEVADLTNLPRLVGATRRDAAYGLADPGRPRLVRAVGRLLARSKVNLARRNIRRANPSARVDRVRKDFVEPNVAERLKDRDYIFLAADTMRARLLFNAIVHQYLIPGVQVGAKVITDPQSGDVTDVYAVSRPVTPVAGCLVCSGLVNRAKLQAEAISEAERRQQAYVDDPDIVSPSVITLNALACAQATNEFMFYMTGMASSDASPSYVRFQAATGRVWYDKPRASPNCIECGQIARSRVAMGDTRRLPTKSRS